MIGRLIVAFLIVCAAGAVMWQRQEAEAADVNALLTENKASEAEKKIALLEQQAIDAAARTAEAEGRVKYLEGQLEELAADCTPAVADDPEVTITAFRWRGEGKPNPSTRRATGKFALVLSGDETSIVRLRVTSSTPWDPTKNAFTWDSASTAAWTIDVMKSGRRVEPGSPQTLDLKKGRGPLVLDLVLDDTGFFTPGSIFHVEVVVEGGAVLNAKTTLP